VTNILEIVVYLVEKGHNAKFRSNIKLSKKEEFEKKSSSFTQID
jgi:hypothetical protein